MSAYRLSSFFCCILIAAATFCGPSKKPVFRRIPPISTTKNIPHGTTTIFIHGTIFPVVSRLMNGGRYPHGLVPVVDIKENTRLTRLARTLENADAMSFPTGSFYFYSWSGVLNFNERKKAAKLLFSALCDHQGPITIIAHSHGCNVALYLAELAEEQGKPLQIDSLILCAPPVQKPTAHLIKSPIFKKIYSFYSTADIVQVLDPQGLYEETKKISIDTPPLFSQRLFQDTSNLVQTRVLFNKKSPGHESFLSPRFVSKLPSLISLLNSAEEKEYRGHYMINIPRAPHAPHFITEEQLSQARIRRSSRSAQHTGNEHNNTHALR